MAVIALTGTTGKLGAIVLRHLLKLTLPSNIIVSVFNPNQSHDELRKLGVQVRKGDYTKPETLVEAYKGADKLFLVSSPALSDDVRFNSHKAAIDAAKEAGVKHVYYTSLSWKDGTTTGVVQAHARTEAYLKQAGITFTIIREGTYVETYPTFLGFFNNSDTEVDIPNDGSVAYVNTEDLGEGNARLLLEPGFENTTVDLTGPELVSITQIVKLLERILGRPIPLRFIGVEAWIKLREAMGAVVPFWASTYGPIAKGDAEVVDPLLEKLLGRPRKTFESTLPELVFPSKEKETMDSWYKTSMK